MHVRQSNELCRHAHAGLHKQSSSAGMQVRSAYRKKGWAFTDPQGIEQCAQEGFSKALQEQAGEGCHMWGAISINKVGLPMHLPANHFERGKPHVSLAPTSFVYLCCSWAYALLCCVYPPELRLPASLF